MGFDFKPDAKFRFRRPDGNHFGAGITRDHQMVFLLVLGANVAAPL